MNKYLTKFNNILNDIKKENQDEYKFIRCIEISHYLEIIKENKTTDIFLKDEEEQTLIEIIEEIYMNTNEFIDKWKCTDIIYTSIISYYLNLNNFLKDCNAKDQDHFKKILNNYSLKLYKMEIF